VCHSHPSRRCLQVSVLPCLRVKFTLHDSRNRAEQEEALNVALIVGGSIVIPHLRRAYALLGELYS